MTADEPTRARSAKAEAVAELLMDPEWSKRSNRSIAAHLGVDHKTVGRIRAELGAGGERLGELEIRVGRDGKRYTAHSVEPEQVHPDFAPPDAGQWWDCPACGVTYGRESSERVGWVRRRYCGVCAGEAIGESPPQMIEEASP